MTIAALALKLNQLKFTKNPILLSFVAGFIFITVAFASYQILSSKQTANQAIVNPTSLGPTATPTPTPDPLSAYNILLLGYGGAGHPGGTLSDVLMVVHIVPKTKQVVFVSVPRDTWLELPVAIERKEKHKINDAFSIGGNHEWYGNKELRYRNDNGGGEMAKYAVEVVTGLPIRYYAAVDFRGFEKVIDELGGVEVNVPVTFDDYFYPVKGLEDLSCDKTPEEIAEITVKYSGFELEKQFPCRYEHLHFDQGVTQMDGVTALKFVRSRHSDQHGGDFARSQRQQALLLGVRDKILSTDFTANSDELFDTYSQIVKTDIDKGTINFMLSLQGDPGDYKVKSINLSTDNVFDNGRSPSGQYILIPKAGEGGWGTVHEYVKEKIEEN